MEDKEDSQNNSKTKGASKRGSTTRKSSTSKKTIADTKASESSTPQANTISEASSTESITPQTAATSQATSAESTILLTSATPAIEPEIQIKETLVPESVPQETATTDDQDTDFCVTEEEISPLTSSEASDDMKTSKEKPKRGKIITIRFTDEEYDELMRISQGEPLSSFIRILIKRSFAGGLTPHKEQTIQDIAISQLRDKFDGLNKILHSIKESFVDVIEKEKNRFF